MDDSMGDNIVKLRGLPWNTSPKEIYNFLNDCNIVNDERGIHMTMNKDGRPSGECLVELVSHVDVEKAKAHNKENLGKRYIEVFEGKRAELEWYISHLPSGMEGAAGALQNDVFARLQGIPYDVTKQEIALFFAGVEIAPYGITITMDRDGRPSGEAYVEFASMEAREQAMKKNKEKIRHRYIEIFKCSKHNVKYVAQSSQFGVFSQGLRASPYGRPGMGLLGRGVMCNGGSDGFSGGGGGGNRGSPVRGGKKLNEKDMKDCKTGHLVFMRGLPYEANQGDVYCFLSPIVPAEVRMKVDEETNRPAGTCEVDFNCHSDAVAAMSKNKLCMGHRYIEMFLRSEPGHDTRYKGLYR